MFSIYKEEDPWRVKRFSQPLQLLITENSENESPFIDKKINETEVEDENEEETENETENEEENENEEESPFISKEDSEFDLETKKINLDDKNFDDIQKIIGGMLSNF